MIKKFLATTALPWAGKRVLVHEGRKHRGGTATGLVLLALGAAWWLWRSR